MRVFAALTVLAVMGMALFALLLVWFETQGHAVARPSKAIEPVFHTPHIHIGEYMRALLALSRGIDALNLQVGRAVTWVTLLVVLVSAGNAVVRKGVS